MNSRVLVTLKYRSCSGSRPDPVKTGYITGTLTLRKLARVEESESSLTALGKKTSISVAKSKKRDLSRAAWTRPQAELVECPVSWLAAVPHRIPLCRARC
jgi:hypothetical protein